MKQSICQVCMGSHSFRSFLIPARHDCGTYALKLRMACFPCWSFTTLLLSGPLCVTVTVDYVGEIKPTCTNCTICEAYDLQDYTATVIDAANYCLRFRIWDTNCKKWYVYEKTKNLRNAQVNSNTPLKKDGCEGLSRIMWFNDTIKKSRWTTPCKVHFILTQF